MELPFPSRAKQRTVCSFLRISFAHADRLEAEAVRASALIDRLESTILAKAFRGELVPQDLKDEPAGVRLNRIRTLRADDCKPKPRRRTAKATSK